MFLLAFPGGSEWLLLFVGLAYFVAVFYLVTLIWKRPDIQENTKLLWTIFFFMAPIIGLIIYALYGRQNRKIY